MKDLDVGSDEDPYTKMRDLACHSNAHMTEFADMVMQKTINGMNTPPPGDFAVVGIGSLGRGEATPFSDIEYLFLIADHKCREYFQDLAVMSYFYIGSLKETRLGSCDIEELSGWFVDERIKGYQIDGISKSSGNVPLSTKDPQNRFIVTPLELCDDYRESLINPTVESKRGDITAMLKFTCLIHAYGERGEHLLKRFVEEKHKIDAAEIPYPRLSVNKEMLMCDLDRHEFSPHYSEYISGFSLDVKSQVYRFPSLMVLDLAVLLNTAGNDSWCTLEGWEWESLSSSLKILLACACFFRLRCYLHIGSRKGQFQIEKEGQLSDMVCREESSQKLVYQRDSTMMWYVSVNEFFELSKRTLTMQRFLTIVSHKDWKGIREALHSKVNEERRDSLMAKFYSCKWSDVLTEFGDDDFYNMDIDIKLAVAHSHLQLKSYKKALKWHLDLHAVHMSKLDNDEVKVMIARGLSQCYEAMGSFEKAEEVCSSVMEYAHRKTISTKTSALLRMELARLNIMRSMYDVRGQREKLFKVLEDLVMSESMECELAAPELSKMFRQCSEEERLEFINNPTREIAHCVYILADLFRTSGDRSLAMKYFTKSRLLGLKMVLDNDIECLTKITILHGLARDFSANHFLKYAQMLLETQKSPAEGLADTFGQQQQIATEMLMTEGELQYQRNSLRASDSEMKEKRQLDGCFGAPPEDHKLDRKIWKSVIEHQNIPGGYYSGKFHKINGNLIREEHGSDIEIHKCYEEAIKNYEEQECFLEIATVHRADAAAYLDEKNYKAAQSSYHEAQKVYEKNLPASCSKRPEYLEILKEQIKILPEEEGEILQQQAEEIETQRNEWRKALRPGGNESRKINILHSNVYFKYIGFISSSTAPNNISLKDYGPEYQCQ